MPKKAVDRELRPFCTLCSSFNSIALVSGDEKRAHVSVLATVSVSPTQTRISRSAAGEGNSKEAAVICLV